MQDKTRAKIKEAVTDCVNVMLAAKKLAYTSSEFHELKKHQIEIAIERVGRAVGRTKQKAGDR